MFWCLAPKHSCPTCMASIAETSTLDLSCVCLAGKQMQVYEGYRRSCCRKGQCMVHRSKVHNFVAAYK